MSNKVKIISKELLYDNFFKLEKYLLSFLQFNGDYSEVIQRVSWVVGKVSAAIVYDRSKNEIIMVKQFRLPTMSMNDDGWLMEIVAGISEDDECAEETIRREMIEEIGYRPEKL